MSRLLRLRDDADGGSVSTDEKPGAMTFVSPRTCGGFVEGGRFGAGALAAEVAGAPAAVWVSSLDGNDSAGSYYRDSEDITGTIAEMYRGTMSFLKRNLRGIGTLVKEGLVRRIGPKKGGRWEVIG